MSDFDAILSECLERIARGEAVAACLARYPQHAAELEPALAAAQALSRLGAYRMPEPARARAKARMRRELAAAGSPPARRSVWNTGWLRGLAGAAAVFLLVTFLGVGVAASQPGDWGYPLRAAAERAPAQFAPDPGVRTRAELRAAERRLADLDRGAGQGASDDALASLLAANEAAFEAAMSLPEPERAAVAARLNAQAGTLELLAVRAAAGQEREAFRLAAQRALTFARQLQPASRPVAPPGPAATDMPPRAPAERPIHTATPRIATRTPDVSPEAPRPAATRARPVATAAPRATITPEPQRPTLTPQGPRMTPTAGASSRTRTPEPVATPGELGPGEGGPGPGGGENGEPGGDGGGDNGGGGSDGSGDSGGGGGNSGG